jgi:hypothetical protein
MKKLKNTTKKHKKPSTEQKSTKKLSKRSKTKYPALDPSVNLKTRQEEINDVLSYFNKLSPKEKEWMNAFMEEENAVNFNHRGPKLNKSKEDKKRIYNKNNARNRCIYTREKAQDKLGYFERVEDIEKGLKEDN